MSDVLLIESRPHLEIWTLNLPEARNPISGAETIDAIEERVRVVNADASVRAVILTGAGTAFSAGGDVRAIAERRGMFAGSPHEVMQGYRSGIQRIPRALHSAEVPLIAAVNGPAIGAGFDLVLACDLRIATTTAKFASSFVKLGIVPGDGGAWLLPRDIGFARAAEMLLTGDPIDAETALAWGIVSRIVDPADLMTQALALAERVVVNPPLAVRMAGRLLRDAAHQTLDQALESAASFQALAHHTTDHTEAVKALLDRRVGEYDAR